MILCKANSLLAWLFFAPVLSVNADAMMNGGGMGNGQMNGGSMGDGSEEFTTSETTTSTSSSGGVTTITTTTTTTTLTSSALWSDEFGDSSTRPDENIWNYQQQDGSWDLRGNGSLQRFSTSTTNGKVENGVLKLVARKINQQYTSALLSTQDKVRFRYGTLEIRAKRPSVSGGLWPTFFTLGSNFGTEGFYRAGEIDIMAGGEGISTQQGRGNSRVVSSAHWGNGDSYAYSTGNRDVGENLSQDFHIYKLEWTPEALKTFVDDKLVWEMNIDRSVVANVEEFHQFHFIVVGLLVGGGFTSVSSGQPEMCGTSSPFSAVDANICRLRTNNQIGAPLPGVLEVDYIRLFNNGFSEVIFGTGSSLFAGNSGTGSMSESTTISLPSSSSTVVSQLNACVRDMDCNFATQWCQLASGTCYEKRVGGTSCIRDRVCWSSDCQRGVCVGGEAPSGMSTTVTVGSGASSTTTLTAAYLMPASDVRCNRDLDCNFNTEWCELASSTCFFKRPSGTSCIRNRACWGDSCRNQFCRGGSAPSGFTYTSTSILVVGSMTSNSGGMTSTTNGMASSSGGMTSSSSGMTSNSGGMTSNNGMITVEANSNYNMNTGSTLTSTTTMESNTNMNTVAATTPLPTPRPSPRPTLRPTPNPTRQPTPRPTLRPSPGPTNRPTNNPTPNPIAPPVTPGPTNKPTNIPTNSPTPNPTTLNPTPPPVTPGPTKRPTFPPVTPAPTTPEPVVVEAVTLPPVTPVPTSPAPTLPPVTAAPAPTQAQVAATAASMVVTAPPVTAAPTDAQVVATAAIPVTQPPQTAAPVQVVTNNGASANAVAANGNFVATSGNQQAVSESIPGVNCVEQLGVSGITGKGGKGGKAGFRRERRRDRRRLEDNRRKWKGSRGQSGRRTQEEVFDDETDSRAVKGGKGGIAGVAAQGVAGCASVSRASGTSRASSRGSSTEGEDETTEGLAAAELQVAMATEGTEGMSSAHGGGYSTVVVATLVGLCAFVLLRL